MSMCVGTVILVARLFAVIRASTPSRKKEREREGGREGERDGEG